MFCAEVGSVRTTGLFIKGPSLFAGLVIAWLRATTLFANFAEAVAEGRGKARADTLRKARHDTLACLRRDDGSVAELPAAELHVGDICVVEAGRIIQGDGDVINGIATVDESAITGESAPVIRESGGDRSAVTGGTTVLSDRIEVRITSNPGETRLVLQVWTDHRSRRHARPQRDPSQGHRQGRDGRALRAAAQHGNSPGDDYR